MKCKNRLNQTIGTIIKNTKGMTSTKLQNIDYPKKEGHRRLEVTWGST